MGHGLHPCGVQFVELVDIVQHPAHVLPGLFPAIRAGRATAPEAMEAVLRRIEEKEDALHCYITIDKEKALSLSI